MGSLGLHVNLKDDNANGLWEKNSKQKLIIKELVRAKCIQVKKCTVIFIIL